MDMRMYNKFDNRTIAQYDTPQNCELAGQKFLFVMDDGIDYSLRFINGGTLEWNFEDEEPKKASYFCKKSDDTTYLVSYELENTDKRTNHTWVIDLENWLVTRIIAVIGEHPKMEYFITPKYEFGAIKRENMETPIYPRHGFTDDVTGTIVQWNYGSMETVHVYYCSNFYRVTYPPEKASSRVFNAAMAKLPSPDEPAVYIKIKEAIYLMSITEANLERVAPGAIDFRCNTMAFLQNYKNVTQTGRAFGTTTFDGGVQPLHLTFTAYGKIIDPIEEYLYKTMTDPNPYIV